MIIVEQSEISREWQGKDQLDELIVEGVRTICLSHKRYHLWPILNRLLRRHVCEALLYSSMLLYVNW